MNIAFIGKPNNPNTLTHLAANRFATEMWKVNAKDQAALIGGRVSLHFKQDEVSYMAGTIIATYEVTKGKPTKMRRIGIVFEEGGRQVNGKRLRWGQEQARH